MDRTIEIALDGTITLIEGDRIIEVELELGSVELDEALELFFTEDPKTGDIL